MAVSVDLPSYLADSLNVQFGPGVMEVVAARYIVTRLLAEFASQTNNATDSIEAVVDQAFDALVNARGLCPEQVRMATASFKYLGERIKDTPNPDLPQFSKF